MAGYAPSATPQTAQAGFAVYLELRVHLIRADVACGWLDEMVRMRRSIRLGSRIQEWQEGYSRLRHSLPAQSWFFQTKFDALSNQAIYSREPLQHFWRNTIEQLKGMRIWKVDPGKLTINLIKDFFLTTCSYLPRWLPD
jgi:hypothetical protein